MHAIEQNIRKITAKLLFVYSLTKKLEIQNSLIEIRAIEHQSHLRKSIAEFAGRRNPFYRIVTTLFSDDIHPEILNLFPGVSNILTSLILNRLKTVFLYITCKYFVVTLWNTGLKNEHRGHGTGKYFLGQFYNFQQTVFLQKPFCFANIFVKLVIG